MLSIQLAPLLDRTGRLITDIAGLIAGPNRGMVDDTVSVSSSLLTSESA